MTKNGSREKNRRNQQPTDLHQTNKKGVKSPHFRCQSRHENQMNWTCGCTIYKHIYIYTYHMIYWSHKFPDISIQSQVLSMEKLRVLHQNSNEQFEAYLADAIAALFGSMLGVSTVATFAESTAGVADGAKTGFCRKGPR